MMPRAPEAPTGSDTSPFDSMLARHGPAEARSHLDEGSLERLARTGSTAVNAAVVVGDLRMSGLLLREAVSPSLYARFIIGFTEAVRTLTTDSAGWFDKFTGDGFIAFWLDREESPLAPRVIPRFCQSVLPAADALIANLKRNSRNFPVGVGLSLGVDFGPCELVHVGGSLTLVGSPIVGATRMVAGARAREALVNINLGATLELERARLEEEGVRLERTVVRTKEYPDGQEAYSLEFGQHAP